MDLEDHRESNRIVVDRIKTTAKSRSDIRARYGDRCRCGRLYTEPNTRCEWHQAYLGLPETVTD